MKKKDRFGSRGKKGRGLIGFFGLPAMAAAVLMTVLTAAGAWAALSVHATTTPEHPDRRFHARTYEDSGPAEGEQPLEFHEYDQNQLDQGDPEEQSDQYPPDEYPPDQYPPDEYPPDQYPQDQYPQDQEPEYPGEGQDYPPDEYREEPAYPGDHGYQERQ